MFSEHGKREGDIGKSNNNLGKMMMVWNRVE